MQYLGIGLSLAIRVVVSSLLAFFALNYVNLNIFSFSLLTYKIVFIVIIVISTYILFKRAKVYRGGNFLMLAIITSLSFVISAYIMLILISGIGLSSFSYKMYPVLFYSAVPLVILIFVISTKYKSIYKKEMSTKEELEKSTKNDRNEKIEEKTVV